MAALMRSARFFSSALQIPKLLRVVSPGTPRASVGLSLKERRTADQRSWRSTVAAGVESAVHSPSKLDNMMSGLERYFQQFARVSRKQLDPVMARLNQEGTISFSHSVALLRLYGIGIFDETSATRLQLVDQLWDKYKQLGIALDAVHYNTLLAIYTRNKREFSPIEFLSMMETDGVTPNRVTYQRLIAQFCEEGNIEGATQVLEQMKSLSMPITDQVFNSFITGHLKSNNPDSARDTLKVMKQTDLEPTSNTYRALALGFAQRGEIEDVKMYISEAEMQDEPLRPSQLLDIYTALVSTGHSDLAPELFPFLKSNAHFNYDAIRTCNQLIGEGYDDAAYQLFLQMPKPARLESDQVALGRFFLRALARHQRPVNKVMELVQDMRDRQVNKDDFPSYVQLAFLEQQTEYGMKLLDKMAAEGFEMKAHYYWPAICQFRDAKNKEGVLEAIRKQRELCESTDDFLDTLNMYAIPALIALGDTLPNIADSLQKCGVEREDTNQAYLLYLLNQTKLEQAINFLDDHKVGDSMMYIWRHLRTEDMNWKGWPLMIQVLGKLKQQGSQGWGNLGHKSARRVVRGLLSRQRGDDWTDLENCVAYMETNNLNILEITDEIMRMFPKTPPELVERLKALQVNDNASGFRSRPVRFQRAGRGEEYSALSLRELLQLEKEQPDNKRLLKQVLMKACSTGNVEEAERVLKDLEDKGFIFSAPMLTQLAFMYARHAKDLDKTSHYIQKLEESYPDHDKYGIVILLQAALQTSAGNVEAALTTLKNFHDKHGSKVADGNVYRWHADIVRVAPDVDSAKRLMQMLVDCGYITADNSELLDFYMMKVLEGEDTDLILKEFEDCVETHKHAPTVNRMLTFFIHREDPDSLQKVVDLTTKIHGLMNVLHHLIAVFIECGHMKKARKILETPGLRTNMSRMNYHCQNFIQRNLIKELELFVETTKDMFGIDRPAMLHHLVQGYVKLSDFDKAKDVLVQFEDEMLEPSPRTLRFLADSLKKNNLPVTFNVPPETEDVPLTTEPTVKAQVTEDRARVTDCLKNGDVATALDILNRNEPSLLSTALNGMTKPWPIKEVKSVFESLSADGRLENLDGVVLNSLPFALKKSLRSNIFLAALNSGRGQEMMDKLSEMKGSVNHYLTFDTLDKLAATAPDLFQQVETMAKKLQSERNHTSVMDLLWAYHVDKQSPHADHILQESTSELKRKNIFLRRFAVQENKMVILEKLLDLNRQAASEAGMRPLYSSILELQVRQGDVTAVERTCERVLEDGIETKSVNRQVMANVKTLLEENNRPVPAWVVEAESSSDSSSSSSDDEKKK